MKSDFDNLIIKSNSQIYRKFYLKINFIYLILVFLKNFKYTK